MTHPGERAGRRRAILAGVVGNVLEWYDFAVYGYFAAVIGGRFFPSADPVASLLASFGAFAAGFLMRPFGALVFGSAGDRLGPRTALRLSILAMAVPTFLIGLLPTYDAIGPAAAVLLVLLRLMQGFAVGGENGSSFTWLVEEGAADRRGLTGSWGVVAVGGGVLLGSAVGAGLDRALGSEAVADWGWRVPFLLGLGISLFGFWLRRDVGEVDEPPAARAATPVREAFRTECRGMLWIVGMNAVGSIGFYLCFTFVAAWLRQVDGFTPGTSLDINTAAMVAMLLVLPLSGHMSDRVGRRPVLLAGALGLLLFAWPVFWLMRHADPTLALVGQVALAVLIGVFSGPIPATVAERFPRQVRCTTLSLTLNFGFGVLGGTTPMIALFLLHRSHDDLSPAWLLMIAATISALCLLPMREGSRDEPGEHRARLIRQPAE